MNSIYTGDRYSGNNKLDFRNTDEKDALSTLIKQDSNLFREHNHVRIHQCDQKLSFNEGNRVQFNVR